MNVHQWQLTDVLLHLWASDASEAITGILKKAIYEKQVSLTARGILCLICMDQETVFTIESIKQYSDRNTKRSVRKALQELEDKDFLMRVKTQQYRGETVIMPTFRVHKDKNFTTVSNEFIKDKRLSLKGKGLLITMFSLPNDWDYSERGLTCICKEGRDSIHSTLKELEEYGYLSRKKRRDAQGHIIDVEYNIYEHLSDNPDLVQNGKKPDLVNPAMDEPDTEAPAMGNPRLESPAMGYPYPENPRQLNTKQSKTKKQSTYESNPIQPNPYKEERNGKEEYAKRKLYEEIIKENISYDLLIKEHPYDRQVIEQLMELIVDTVSTSRGVIRVARDDVPAEVVRSRMMKLDSEHILYVIETLQENTSQIKNIKQYMLTSLYNAPLTIDSYYVARVNHDMAQTE